MIKYVTGNLLSSECQTLVNPVNTVGIMGKGLALEFKKVFPDMFEEYQDRCRAQKLNIGTFHIWKGEPKWVLNFPTKKHWRDPSNLEWIISGLQAFRRDYRHLGIESVAFPKLGCGYGRLRWYDVKQEMQSYLMDLDITIELYE